MIYKYLDTCMLLSPITLPLLSAKFKNVIQSRCTLSLLYKWTLKLCEEDSRYNCPPGAERKVCGQVTGGPWTKSLIPETASVSLIHFLVLQKTDTENSLSPMSRCSRVRTMLTEGAYQRLEELSRLKSFYIDRSFQTWGSAIFILNGEKNLTLKEDALMHNWECPVCSLPLSHLTP